MPDGEEPAQAGSLASSAHEGACSACGSAPDMRVHGACIGCVLSAARRPRLPSRIGRYRVLGQLGEGGMGIVYRVYDPKHQRDVALKMLRGGALASELDRLALSKDLKFLRRLQHPHIVQVYDAQSTRDGAEYFTMQLIEGGSLDQTVHRADFRCPRAAAQLIATLARTVQFCHVAEPPFLHQDIKPANILIGQNRHPYLVDFGIAGHLDDATRGHTGWHVGTPMYMAPEQRRSTKRSPSTDVYSLGAVLYELISGRPIHQASSGPELLACIEHEPITPPHKHAPKLDRGLSKICMTALARSPLQRYPTAAALADDLERHLRGEEPRLLPQSAPRRALSLLRYNPVVVGASVLLLALVLFGVQLVGDLKQELRESALHQVRSYALAKAAAMLHDLTGLAHLLQQDARQVERKLEAASPWRERPFELAPLVAHSTASGAIHGVTLFDASGTILARSVWKPTPGGDYQFRDYFSSAKDLAAHGERAATFSRAFVSEPDGHVEIAISAPLFASDDHFLGLLLAVVRAGPSLGSLYENKATDQDSMYISIVGPRDRDRQDAARPIAASPSYLLLLHRSLKDGNQVQVSRTLAQRLHDWFGAPASASHRFDKPQREPLAEATEKDPLGDSARGWLTAFAPIGQTGFVVVVQQKQDTATHAGDKFARRMLWVGVLWAVMVLPLSIWLTRRALRRARFGQA